MKNRSIFAGLLLIVALTSPVFAKDAVTDSYGDRDMFVYVPTQLPAQGKRALVVVLHGGMGNAERISSGKAESGLNMNTVAEKDGFIVAYLNGTRAALLLGPSAHVWNAGGGCCGAAFKKNIDDVKYIEGAVGYLSKKYGIDPKRVYGMGHSNGAMMTQRLLCETNLFAAGVAIAGPLNIETRSCPAAQGERILAIHGEKDKNVLIEGGVGSGISRVKFHSEVYAKDVFTRSGATYDLQIIKGADHYLDHINEVIRQTDGSSVAEESARFFGLAGH